MVEGKSVATASLHVVTPVCPNIVIIPAVNKHMSCPYVSLPPTYFGSALGSIGLFLGGTAVELKRRSVSSRA